MIHVAFTVDFLLDPHLVLIGVMIYLLLGLVADAYVQFRILNRKFTRKQRMKATGFFVGMFAWPIALPLLIREVGW